MIFSVDEIGQNARQAALKSRAGKRTGLKPASAPPAVHCRPNLQRPSPDPIKETKKKKEIAEEAIVSGRASHVCEQRDASGEMGLGEFERRIAKVFEREGYGYEGLMALQVKDLEQSYDLMAAGELSFPEAVGQLLKKFRALGNELERGQT
ncbi:MAG: hypothetical protein ACU0BK_01605 [Shimia sp.]|uniref:hypothetical protein n=1 Tax=Shimia sp. TaxID=1954381 RepID=UPI004058582F